MPNEHQPLREKYEMTGYRLAKRVAECQCGLVHTFHRLEVAYSGEWFSSATVYRAIKGLEAEKQALHQSLQDSNAVHSNILQKKIALTKEQAIHIAGLPADVEQQLQDAEQNKRVLNALNDLQAMATAHAIAYAFTHLLPAGSMHPQHEKLLAGAAELIAQLSNKEVL